MAEAPQKTPVKSEERAIERAPAEWSPLASMRREFDRMLEEFPWAGWRRPLARGLFDVEPFFRGFARAWRRCLPSTSRRRRRSTRSRQSCRAWMKAISMSNLPTAY